MLKASQNKNVLSCRLKAAWDDVLRVLYVLYDIGLELSTAA